MVIVLKSKTYKTTLKFESSPLDDKLEPYDVKSIMHHDGTLRGRFQNPVIRDKITGKGIEVNRKMSPLDIAKLNKMYPCASFDFGCGKL